MELFGSIVLAKDNLTEEQLKRYQSVYCGLCKMLRDKYGQLHRFTLNYDMTFLVLLLSSLYEPEDCIKGNHCVFRVGRTKQSVSNPFTEYAADMTILLTYFKCLDDWEDENKKSRYWIAKALKKDIANIKEQHPRQYRSVEDSLEQLHQIEKDPAAGVDKAIHFAGEMLAEVFVWKEDFWQDILRNFGYDLGRFVYLMDAALDGKKDQKKGLYNPLLKQKVTKEQTEELLNIELGRAMQCFDKLPLVQDEDILKNVLYYGVWCPWYAAQKKNDRK